MRIGRDVVGDPTLQPLLAVLPLHERADLVAGDHLQKVGNPRAGHDVRQPRGDGGVGRRLGPVVLLRLLRCLSAEEDGVVSVLVVAQWQEAELRQLRLPAVGDRDLGGALEGLVTVVTGKHVGRQSLDLAAILGTADRRAPAGLGKGIGEPGTQHVRRVHPRVVVVGHRLGVALLIEFDLLKIELLDHLRVLAIGEPCERPRHRQHHVTGIVGIAEAAPLRVGLVEEDLLEIAGLRQLREAVHAQQFRRGGGDERTETSG